MTDKIINAFNICKKSKNRALICILALIILYIVLSFLGIYIENRSTEEIIEDTVSIVQEEDEHSRNEIYDNESNSSYINWQSFIRVFKDFTTICASVLGSSLLTMTIVEKRNKNEIYTDAIKEFVSNANYKMDFTNLKKLCVDMNKEVTKSSFPDELISNIVLKLQNHNE